MIGAVMQIKSANGGSVADKQLLNYVNSFRADIAKHLNEVSKVHKGHEKFRAQVKQCLFRATDAVYALPGPGRLALVLDDCKSEDVPRLLQRIQKNLQEFMALA